MAVVAMGRLNVYEARGVYQIILEYLELEGAGALQLAFEQLKGKLSSEGLFHQGRKRPLPFLPQRIGVVTSPTGSVIRDILHVINRRFPNVNVEIAAVKVQGEGAAEGIVRALQVLNERGNSDVIVLARGGGSLEDLEPFNSEIVARAIFSSNIPIVSAVGHETDYTIADFTADMRAPTPSSAAELIVPEKEVLVKRTAEIKSYLTNVVTQRIRLLRQDVVHLCGRLIDPRRQVADYRLRVDDLLGRTRRACQMLLVQNSDRLSIAEGNFARCGPRVLIEDLNVLLEQYARRLAYAIRFYFQSRNAAFRVTLGKLNALNPLDVLERGFSITRKVPGYALVKDVGQVDVGQQVAVTLAKGQMVCRIEGKRENGETNIRKCYERA
jgi:exodeoxyribonuclease VII large subunit